MVEDDEDFTTRGVACAGPCRWILLRSVREMQGMRNRKTPIQTIQLLVSFKGIPVVIPSLPDHQQVLGSALVTFTSFPANIQRTLMLWLVPQRFVPTVDETPLAILSESRYTRKGALIVAEITRVPAVAISLDCLHLEEYRIYPAFERGECLASLQTQKQSVSPNAFLKMQSKSNYTKN